MFKVLIYENAKGESSVKERIMELEKKSHTDKTSRIALHKIYEYIAILERKGTRVGEKYTKHIEGDIWELRPLKDRMFFFCWIDNQIVLLHCFSKKTQKTPRREIEQAARNLANFLGDRK